MEPWARTCAACRRTKSTRSRRSHGRLDTRRNADGRALPASGGTMATGPRRVGRDQSGGSGLPEQPWVLTRGAVRARRSVLGVSAHDHPDPAVGIDHPVAGGRTAESSPMPKGAVLTDPDGRREAVNVPVAAMGAPDGDLHRAGMVPVREAVEHHRGVGGSSRHRDRLSGSRDARSGAPRRQVAPRTSARSRTPPPPGGTAVGAAGRQKRNDTDIADRERCRLTVTTVPTSPGFGGPFRWRHPWGRFHADQQFPNRVAHRAGTARVGTI